MSTVVTTESTTYLLKKCWTNVSFFLQANMVGFPKRFTAVYETNSDGVTRFHYSTPCSHNYKWVLLCNNDAM